jgi:hypothetical protein
MKKIILGFLMLGLLFCTGCTEENLESRAEQGLIEYVDLTEDVIADKNTHILYFYYSKGNNSYLSPYYSENGKLCKYEDGKIIEVENGSEVNTYETDN